MKLGIYGCAAVLIIQAACVQAFDRTTYLGTIFEAAAKGDSKQVRSFVRDGVNPNVKDEYGNASLHYAKDLDTIKTLLDLGADIDIQNKNGVTRLHMEVIQGHLILVKFLLDHNADANAKDTRGATPLHCATVISYFERPSQGKMLATFLATESFYAALAVVAIAAAVAGGEAAVAAVLPVVTGVVLITTTVATAVAAVDISVRNEILHRLLEHGALVNARDNNGNTPLHTLAAGQLIALGQRHGGVVMAQHLISSDARLDIKNRFGETPYDVAKRYKRKLLLPLLNPRKRRPRIVTR